MELHTEVWDEGERAAKEGKADNHQHFPSLRDWAGSVMSWTICKHLAASENRNGSSAPLRGVEGGQEVVAEKRGEAVISSPAAQVAYRQRFINQSGYEGDDEE